MERFFRLPGFLRYFLFLFFLLAVFSAATAGLYGLFGYYDLEIYKNGEAFAFHLFSFSLLVTLAAFFNGAPFFLRHLSGRSLMMALGYGLAGIMCVWAISYALEVAQGFAQTVESQNHIPLSENIVCCGIHYHLMQIALSFFAFVVLFCWGCARREEKAKRYSWFSQHRRPVNIALLAALAIALFPW